MYPINVVEKETGISKYLLRMWERRYEFPRPIRDGKGERVYTNLDVEKLKLVKILMEGGYRPSKIINQNLDELKLVSKSFVKPETNKANVVVLITTSILEADVREALKNHSIDKFVNISNLEDLKNISL
jgi:DNA-binding transcriptional MerR regulator